MSLSGDFTHWLALRHDECNGDFSSVVRLPSHSAGANVCKDDGVRSFTASSYPSERSYSHRGGTANTYLRLRPSSVGPNGDALTSGPSFHWGIVKIMMGISSRGFSCVHFGCLITSFGPRKLCSRLPSRAGTLPLHSVHKTR